MGKPYSMDLRARVVAYVEAGHSCRAAARVFRVSASTAVRLAAAQRERGDIAPRPQGRTPGTVGKLAAHQAFLLEIVQAEPDITLKELAGALVEAHGVRGQLFSLHRALRRAGTSYIRRADRGRARCSDQSASLTPCASARAPASS